MDLEFLIVPSIAFYSIIIFIFIIRTVMWLLSDRDETYWKYVIFDFDDPCRSLHSIAFLSLSFVVLLFMYISWIDSLL
jgi:hypothetical protein